VNTETSRLAASSLTANNYAFAVLVVTIASALSALVVLRKLQTTSTSSASFKALNEKSEIRNPKIPEGSPKSEIRSRQSPDIGTRPFREYCPLGQCALASSISVRAEGRFFRTSVFGFPSDFRFSDFRICRLNYRKNPEERRCGGLEFLIP